MYSAVRVSCQSSHLPRYLLVEGTFIELIEQLVAECAGPGVHSGRGSAGNQSELARRMGVKPQAISAWLRGRKPDMMSLRKVACYTGRPLGALIELAYGIPAAELGAGSVELAVRADPTLDAKARRHYLNQYRELQDATEARRARCTH